MSANKFADKLASEPDEAALMRRIAKEFVWPGIMEPYDSATAIHFIAKALAGILEKKQTAPINPLPATDERQNSLITKKADL